MELYYAKHRALKCQPGSSMRVDASVTFLTASAAVLQLHSHCNKERGHCQPILYHRVTDRAECLNTGLTFAVTAAAVAVHNRATHQVKAVLGMQDSW